MVDRVLVTVQSVDCTYGADLDLPADVPMAQLEPQLLTFLADMAPATFNGWSALRICKGSAPIEPAETLASMGLWDGSILTLRRE